MKKTKFLMNFVFFYPALKSCNEFLNGISHLGKSGFVFGGISDDRKSKAEKSKNTIYIEAAGGFGGVTIRDSKDKKEKLD